MSDDILAIVGQLRVDRLHARRVVVKYVKTLKILFLDILHQLLESCRDLFLGNTHGDTSSENGKKLELLSLVIDELDLFFLTTDISELSSDTRISEANHECSRQRQG